MAVPTSGQVNFSTVNSVFGYGQWMSQYAGRIYYFSGASGANYGYFPGNNFWMSYFYGKSNHDEWNCACDCNCNCGK